MQKQNNSVLEKIFRIMRCVGWEGAEAATEPMAADERK